MSVTMRHYIAPLSWAQRCWNLVSC